MSFEQWWDSLRIVTSQNVRFCARICDSSDAFESILVEIAVVTTGNCLRASLLASISSGQQPISLESLQLVIRERDMPGEYYDSLLQFDEEAGPEVEAMFGLGSIGASQADIDRCPLRTMGSKFK